MTTNIFALTEAGWFPDYMSVNKTEDAHVTVTIRGTDWLKRSKVQAEYKLTKEQAKELAHNILRDCT